MPAQEMEEEDGEGLLGMMELQAARAAGMVEGRSAGVTDCRAA